MRPRGGAIAHWSRGVDCGENGGEIDIRLARCAVMDLRVEKTKLKQISTVRGCRWLSEVAPVCGSFVPDRWRSNVTRCVGGA